MSHSKASQTYRQHYVQGHEQQCFASMMAMRYLLARYASAVKHIERMVQALKNMEGKV